MTWNWCLTLRPQEHVSDLTIVSDASLAPGGGMEIGCRLIQGILEFNQDINNFNRVQDAMLL
eukprot:929223-Prorocentrum_lima.AAC.1